MDDGERDAVDALVVREVFEKQATSVAMLDVGWCGGIGEAKKIATMAESYELPVAPHDCTGPCC
jgi:L-alanine-DL-glutamate epimerase-like enolase superfamily enzyme